VENIPNYKLSFKGKNKIKIVFFVKPGLDNFLEDIISNLSEEYHTKKVTVTNLNQIDEEMKWADICWFEWCDELICYGSSLDFSNEKKILCRIHSYEAFTDYPSKVTWEKVDNIIFVAEHIKNLAVKKFNLDEKKTIVVPNGINTKKWTYSMRDPGFNIAYVGYINYKKGPMLLLHGFKAIYEKNKNYKLFIAGEFQDERDVLYFNKMVFQLGLENNVIYEGWQDNLNSWLEDKNYILCTSILESQNMSIMQGMSKGIKPVIHNFVGAENIYPKKFLWNTIEEAVHMVVDDEYTSDEYVSFVKDNYELNNQINKLKSLFINLINSKKDESFEKPLVTIGITNYDCKEYLPNCIDSFLNGTYKNIEIIVVDDNSADGSKEIIEEYEGKYSNIFGIYHNVNSGGASKGINEIINNAKGKYFQWIACDDFAQKDAIYKFVQYLEKNPEKDYVYSDLNIIDENGVKVNQWNYTVYPQNKVIEKIFKSASGLIPMNCLYRLSFFKDKNINWIVYNGNDFSADTLNSLQFIKHNWSYGKIPSAVINYRIHSNNLSYNLKKRIANSLSIFQYIIENFSEEIYASEFQWNKLENRPQFKFYLLAQFYYNQIQNHITLNAIPEYIRTDIDKKELVECCCLFLKEGLNFLEEGLKLGDTYKAELLNLKKLYKNFHEEANALGVIQI
jgi:glycosyltransferase involved in cell wall biosynthesis